VLSGEDQKSNYVIFEDGYDADIWGKMSDDTGDILNRIIIHQRWVEACIKEN
jgi:hypothetical protein